MVDMKNTCSRKPYTFAEYRETVHFQQRVEQRHLGSDQVQFALLYGSRMFCGGACAHIVRHQDIPSWIDPKLTRRYHGAVVITALDEVTLVTAYQDSKHGYSRLKKKFRN